METKRSILIVEDDDVDAEILVKLFRVAESRPGVEFELHREMSLAGALTALASASYDLVFLDLGLPDTSREKSLARIKTLYPNIPVVVMTGLNDVETALESLRSGAQDYLVKGHSTAEELLRCSIYAIERHRMKRELEKTAAELAQKTSILQSIINTMGDGVVVTDKLGRLTLFNPAAVEMLDVSWMETSPADWPAWNGAPDPVSAKRIASTKLPIYAALRGENVDDEELLVQTEKYPEGRYVSVTARLIKSDAVMIDGCVAVLRDITNRRKLNQMKDEFVSVVSHELRTPLTSISGSLGLVLGGVAGELPEEAREMIDIARRNSDRLVRLINDLLDIQKLEAGKMKLHRQKADISELIQRAMAANEGYATSYGVEFVFESDLEKEVTVSVDEDRILQVMANLLSNASKYSPENGVITVKIEPADGQFVMIGVTDEGPGIPEEFQHEIFGKFMQADSSTKRQKDGTGLGLNICKTIVNLHGGEICFDSTEGEGTTFYFTLPAIRV